MNLNAFLLVDIGNSLIKWAVADIFEANALPVVVGEMPTAKATTTRIEALAKKFPQHYLVLASVVPKLVPIFCRVFKRRFHLVTADSPALGLGFDYPRPAELGADRLAAAVAVHADGKWPVIVVNCGTATAFTVLDKKGNLCGGAIAPGLQTQLAALLGKTAQLPNVVLSPPRHYLARSTEEAIRSGVMLSFQGGVKETLHQLSAALPGRRPHIVLTGGNASSLTSALDLPHTLRPLLVFEGLRIMGVRIFTPA